MNYKRNATTKSSISCEKRGFATLSFSSLLLLSLTGSAAAQNKVTQAKPALDPVTVVSSEFYQTDKPVAISWSVPSTMKAPGAGWYEFVLRDNTRTYHTVTSDNLVSLDSLSSGLYRFTVVAHDGTDSSVASGQFAVAKIGIEESAESSGVRLFPNPIQAGTQKLNILLTGFSGDQVSIRLYDSDGNVIDLSNVQREGDQLVISAKELVNGVYYCEIMSGDDRYTAPLIVER